MRTECLNYKYAHDAPLPLNRLLLKVGNKMQVCTQRYDKRPYGVGLLIAGYDVSLYVLQNLSIVLELIGIVLGLWTAHLSNMPVRQLLRL